jgi:hypothetical protein
MAATSAPVLRSTLRLAPTRQPQPPEAPGESRFDPDPEPESLFEVPPAPAPTELPESPGPPADEPVSGALASVGVAGAA